MCKVGHERVVAIGYSCKKLNGEIHNVAFSVSGLQFDPDVLVGRL